MQEINSRKTWVDAWSAIRNSVEELETLVQLAEESNDESFQSEIQKELASISLALDDLEFRNMLSGVDDKRTAIVTVHSGAGGTESQDWAEMLLRMYMRWPSPSVPGQFPDGHCLRGQNAE